MDVQSDISSDEEISAVPSTSTGSIYLTPSASGIAVGKDFQLKLYLRYIIYNVYFVITPSKMCYASNISYKDKQTSDTPIDSPSTPIASGLATSTYEFAESQQPLSSPNAEPISTPNDKVIHINTEPPHELQHVAKSFDTNEDDKSEESVDTDDLPELVEIQEQKNEKETIQSHNENSVDVEESMDKTVKEETESGWTFFEQNFSLIKSILLLTELSLHCQFNAIHR